MERMIEKLTHGCKFRLYPEGEVPSEVLSPAYDDTDWETVRLPHDWAVSGVFKELNDCSYSAVIQDGIDRAIEHSGRTGALPIVGLGVYRLPIEIREEDRGRRIFLEFDGVMWTSDIYVNGTHVFHNHFGYKSFNIDITDYVEYGGVNLVTVAARVFPDCSRWYPGAGIYRNVYLVKKSAIHIPYNGVWLRQLEVGHDFAKFLLAVEYEGPESVSFRADIRFRGETVVQVAHGTYLGELSDIFVIPDVKLWDLESPNLYEAHVSLLDEGGHVVDSVVIPFGARTIRFTPEDGFILNGRQQKLNGVCNHHDLGSLGAAVNVAALRRQLRIMREMGVNAIRTSHNPPAPELLDLCDELGFVVMDEFFDEWHMPKIKNGYAKDFRTHAAEDVVDIIRRDRNHPSIILWSIGNEVAEQWDKEGWRAAMMLTETVHRIDPTRPTTAGLSAMWQCFDHHIANFVDVAGINYQPHLYAEIHRQHPNMVLLGSETASCVSTRGVYHLPAEIEIPAKIRPELTASAYEMACASWAYYPEREFAVQDDLPYVAGEFVWTGMDYLGEPTPYYNQWPSRSSYFGIVDIAGLPKNRFYGYKAHWTSADVLHIFPHWNWEGMEGQTVPVHVYTNWPEVELFVNGVSQGKRRLRETSETPMEQIERYRLIWPDVIYQPGEVKAVAYDENGEPAAEQTVKTAGEPDRVLLSADRDSIANDGVDLVYITAAITDKYGVVCPHANHRLTFSVSGAGELLTTDAGDQRETESFARADKKALAGYLVGCVRSLPGNGASITVTVTGDGLTDGQITIGVES